MYSFNLQFFGNFGIFSAHFINNLGKIDDLLRFLRYLDLDYVLSACVNFFIASFVFVQESFA